MPTGAWILCVCAYVIAWRISFRWSLRGQYAGRGPADVFIGAFVATFACWAIAPVYLLCAPFRGRVNWERIAMELGGEEHRERLLREARARDLRDQLIREGERDLGMGLEA